MNAAQSANLLAALERILDLAPSHPIKEEELRIPCLPGDEVGERAHKHLCKSCGTCWSHSDALSGPFCDISKADHIKAHSCPSCGEEQYFKHH